MRIAIIGDPIDQQKAGIHVYTKEMVKAMIEVNERHELYLIREKIDKQFDDIEQIEVKIGDFPGAAAWRKFVSVPRVLNQMKMDVVIEPAHFGPWNLKPSIKRVTIIHDLTPILFPQFHRRTSSLLQRIFLPAILKRTDLIIANSENTKSDICKVYPNVCDKVVRIYPGVQSIFRPVEAPDVLKNYGISKPYFLFVGTIEPRKNISTLLKAYQIYREQNEGSVKLVLVGGKGWKSKKIYSEIRNHHFSKDIIEPGYVKMADLPALYSGAMGFIYPSLYEGFGFPVLEALSCGTPVLVAQNSSLIEVGGDIATFFHEKDYITLSEQMRRKLSINYNKKRSLECEMYVKGFSWHDYAEKLFSALN
ncbi:MAG: glycosyltransferase family 4 protein [Bacteroidia bacterium]|nr:glycosyltransferase family 4 protein [Bacteroidia bacterium]